MIPDLVRPDTASSAGSVAPAPACSRTSIFSRNWNWWQATKLAGGSGRASGSGAGRSAGARWSWPRISWSRRRNSPGRDWSVSSPMILIEFLLAPTVPSAPRPKNTRAHSRPVRCRTRSNGEREVGHIIDDADGEVVLRRGLRQFVEDRLDHGRREFLGGQAVAAADDHAARLRSEASPLSAGFAQGGDHVQVERFADGTRFLGAVEHRDGSGTWRATRRRNASTENGR